jgi:peptidoglycan DL-endopeptidase CwlO
VTLLVAVVLAGPAGPATATPDGTQAIAAARAEAARLQREVARLDTEVELLAEDWDAAQVRLDGVIQAAARHRAELERADGELDAARAAFAGDVRDIYAQGPLAPLELLLAARDAHELAVAKGVAGNLLDHDLEALARVGTAALAARDRAHELEATQAEALALRQRLASRAAAIERRLDRRRELLAATRADVGRLVAAERARQEARRRALVAAAAARARALGLGGFADGPPPSRAAAGAVRAALGQLGKPYRWGASGTDAFDCSGLTSWAYGQEGVGLPRVSRQQWSAGRHVDPAQLRPGDLVFFARDPADPATIHHVGLYLGQGLMVHAPHTGARVRVDAVGRSGYAGAVRVAG